MYIRVKQEKKSGHVKRNNNEVKVVPPVLQGVETGNELFSELLVDDDEVDRRSFSREVVDGVDLSEVNVSSCVFDHVSFPGCRFRESRLTDVLFENCDLSNVDLSGERVVPGGIPFVQVDGDEPIGRCVE